MPNIFRRARQRSGAGASRAAHAANHDSKEAAEDSAVAPFLSGVKGWLGALQLSAILVAMGFIGKLSLQQFLGVETGSWSALDMSLFAGRWVADTLTLILGELFAPPWALLAAVAVLATPAVLSATLPARHRWVRPATFLGIGLSTVGLIVVLCWCEMPTVQMKDWLTRSLRYQLPTLNDGAVDGRAGELRLIRLVAAMEGKAQPNRTGCPQVDPPALKRELRYDNPTEHAQEYLQAIYTCSVLVCLLAWFTLFSHAPVDEGRLVDEVFRVVRLVVSVVLLPVASCFVPYVYAKLIYPTLLPVATVTFAPEKGSDGHGAKAPESGEEHEKARPAKAQFLVVDTTDKEVSLISLADDPPAIQRWPRESIQVIEQFGSEDVLNDELQKCDWLPQVMDANKARPKDQ
jgi:hypothetical protein